VHLVSFIIRIQHKFVVGYQCIGPTWTKQSTTDWPLQVGLKSHPEITVTNYQTTPRNIPEQQRPHL